MNPWDAVKKQLEALLSAESYQNWVSRTSFAQVDGETLWVWVPDEQTKTWLESEYSDKVYAIIQAQGFKSIVYDTDPPRHGRYHPPPAPVMNSKENELDSPLNQQLMPKFTFESLMV